MTDFWGLEEEEKVTGEYESGGFKIIPHDTSVKMILNDIKWSEAGNFSEDKNDYVDASWKVLAPEEFKNCMVFQKIRVLDGHESKARKAKRMLLSIDYNAGGKLATLKEKPTDAHLQKALKDVIVCGRVCVWELDDKQGNYIQGIKPKDQYQETEAKRGGGFFGDDDDSDVPF